MKRWCLMASAATVLCASGAVAQERAATPHPIFTPESLQWMPAPAALPAGAKIAVLKGDPTQEGIFVIRLSAPAGWRVMPHWHPTSENVTVISGTFGFGTGSKFEKSQGRLLAAGSFTSIPPTHHHFAWAESDMVVQVSGMGPFQLYYVNPEDDPAKGSKPAKQ